MTFVISVPKSGTYLMAELLKHLGLQSTNIHLSTHDYEDHRYTDKSDIRAHPKKYATKIPFEFTVPLIRKGQFSWGHIPHDPRCVAVLKKLKKLLILRQLRDVIISSIRHQIEIRQDLMCEFVFNRNGRFKEAKTYFQSPLSKEHLKIWFRYYGKENLRLIENMQPWFGKKNIFSVRFEDLIAKNGQPKQISTVKGIIDFLQIDINTDNTTIKNVIQDTLVANTHTKTDKHIDHRTLWDDEIEELFEFYGFKWLNEKFGYL